MKKRKTPILLVSLLIVGLLLVAIANFSGGAAGQDQRGPALTDPQLTTGDTALPPKSKLSSFQGGEAMADKRASKARPGPTVSINHPEPTKPKPDPSGVSTQWYDSESGRGGK